MKLLGTLPMPDGATSFSFPLMQARNDDFVRAAARGVRFERVELQMQKWWKAPGDRGEALKADGISIETLRRIPGFIEHKES